MFQEKADKLYKLAYQSFERRPEAALAAPLAMKGAASEVQFRLMKNIAELKHAQDATQAKATLKAIESDVLLAQTMGFMTTETSEQMQNIIQEVDEV